MRTADWSEWSDHQIRALCALDRVCPVHQTLACKAAKVTARTFTALELHGAVLRVSLFEEGRPYPMPYYTLTNLGEQIVKDWRSWNESVATSLTAIFGGTAT
ncbi:MAG: hypothetical protein B7Y36_08330 [Novosphingobium sp. 28-62-57]|uniref:hypothetical protein n=1 Tax=Novosphingobium sp. 28-62-57 TaxID=1970409 RepID=UPI000BD1F864|nr:hypothetical protein [Novosphingobium sp. 28-62-57]OYW47930.1 MAG: hypothetical protein B7Z36_01420 [Novosphingobium sp. 12-63-9]OYZ10823.1 MAG: hypothetical protein B7Y36_08330 [Novosphingobium sp. 28-62-57]HQS70013.1 hypothetical protein [Novosphingobium sp.]